MEHVNGIWTYVDICASQVYKALLGGVQPVAVKVIPFDASDKERADFDKEVSFTHVDGGFKHRAAVVCQHNILSAVDSVNSVSTTNPCSGICGACALQHSSGVEWCCIASIASSAQRAPCASSVAKWVAGVNAGIVSGPECGAVPGLVQRWRPDAACDRVSNRRLRLDLLPACTALHWHPIPLNNCRHPRGTIACASAGSCEIVHSIGLSLLQVPGAGRSAQLLAA